MSYIINTKPNNIIPQYYSGYYLAGNLWSVLDIKEAALFSDRENAESIMNNLIVSLKANDERSGKEPLNYEMIIEEI